MEEVNKDDQELDDLRPTISESLKQQKLAQVLKMKNILKRVHGSPI